MTTTISGNSIAVSGIVAQTATAIGQKIATFQADFTGVNSSYLVDLTQQQSAGLFSSPQTMYMDNSTNPEPVVVNVSITGQVFEVPPYSNGYYLLAAAPSSQITLTSAGGAGAINNVAFFNFYLPPITWINAPAGAGTAITAADGAIATLGAKADAAVVNPASSATLIALTKGLLTELLALQSVSPVALTWTQTVVNLAAGVSNNFLAANANRKGLRWMNIGANPCTIAPGAGAVTVGNGLQYNGSAGAGFQGGADSFDRNANSTQAFSGISTLGTTLVVWEGA